jgi:hypothetical protein
MKELRDLAARGREDDGPLPPIVGTFLRGLSIGALVGAAIAGSALLRRRVARGSDPDEPKRVGPDDAVRSG